MTQQRRHYDGLPVRELCTALHPFAAIADALEPSTLLADDTRAIYGPDKTPLTVGDFRRMRELLQRLEVTL